MKVQDISFHFQLKLLMEAIAIKKHTPIKRSEKEIAAMRALQASINKARAQVNQVLRTILFCLFAFPAFSQSINEVIMDPDPVAPVFYDYMSRQECYTLNEEWIIHPYTGQEWIGYWVDGFFYSDDQRFYFTADSAYQEHWPSIDLWREEDFPIHSSKPVFFLPSIKQQRMIEAASWGLIAIGGWVGGRAEASYRLHGHSRDFDSHEINDKASMLLTGTGAAGLGGISLTDRTPGWQLRIAWRVLGAPTLYHLCAQAGYYSRLR